MSTYKITAVNSQREWQGSYGPMISYDIDIVGEDSKLVGGIELAQKPTTPPPTVGATLNGSIDTSGKFGPKFKKEQAQGGGGGGGGARPRDPKERESIERQVALKAAVELVVSFSPAENEKPDFNFTKTALTGFFDHALALIQDKPVERTAEPTPAPAPQRPVGARPSAVSPFESTMVAMREAYAKWAGDDPTAPAAWQNKLTSMGLENVKDANDEQLEELLRFLG